jgi:hypothetical protein
MNTYNYAALRAWDLDFTVLKGRAARSMCLSVPKKINAMATSTWLAAIEGVVSGTTASFPL